MGGADEKDILPKFHPFITVQEEYNNNIFLTNRHKKDDFITTASPGFRFSALEEKTYGIDLNFVAGFIFYAKNNNLNYFSPSGTLNGWYTLAPNLTFRIRDYLIRSDAAREQVYNADAQPDQYLLSTVRGQQAIYIRNVVEPAVEYQFAKDASLSVLYRNNIYNVSGHDLRFEDSMENTITPKFNYWFDIRNGVSLEYDLTFGDYERSADQLSQGVRTRYTHRFNPRTSIFGEYYFQNQNFDFPGVDYNVQNPSLGIEYKFSPTFSGVAQLGYYWQNPDRGSGETGPSINLSLRKSAEKTTYTLSFQGGYTEDYFTAQNLGFAKYYRAYGTINHRLTEKMTLIFTGSLERPTYGTGQKDWIWGTWGSASYQLLKWLSLSLQISYREDHSNLDAQSYSEYRTILGATATF